MNDCYSHEASSDEGSSYASTVPTSPDSSPLVAPLRADHVIDASLSPLCDHSKIFSAGQSSAELLRDSPSVGIRQICCIGAGYVGGPTAAVIALYNPSIIVEVLDRDENRIAQWNSPHLPIHEPSLDSIVRLTRDGGYGPISRSAVGALHKSLAGNTIVTKRPANLAFTSDSQKSISRAQIILIAVNTPTKTYGLGAGLASNMTALDSSIKDIARYAQPGTIVVEKSTVPCGTANRVRKMLNSFRPGITFEILSNPEFLSEGSAIQNLMQPDRVIIGSSDTDSGRKAAASLMSVYNSWIPQSKMLLVNAWSAELSKLVANAMLAQRISSINSISAICEKTGADVQEVAKSIGFDPRIGPQFLKAGVGFGGSCFRKDIASLTYLAHSLGLEEISHYWSQVLVINELQRRRFAKKVIQRLNESLVGKKISILGFAFKCNTGDTRESPAVDVIKVLCEERPKEIAIFDAYCKESDILQEIAPTSDTAPCQSRSSGLIKCYDDPYQACSQADAVIVLTDCEQFCMQSSIRCDNSKKDRVLLNRSHEKSASSEKSSVPNTAAVDALMNKAHTDLFLTDTTVYRLLPLSECAAGCQGCERESISRTVFAPLEWGRIAQALKEPKWIFDGRGVVNVGELEKLGVHVEAVGRKCAEIELRV